MPLQVEVLTASGIKKYKDKPVLVVNTAPFSLTLLSCGAAACTGKVTTGVGVGVGVGVGAGATGATGSSTVLLPPQADSCNNVSIASDKNNGLVCMP
jgi:hypothetical protein